MSKNPQLHLKGFLLASHSFSGYNNLLQAFCGYHCHIPKCNAGTILPHIYSYFFAQVVWPIIVPLSVLLLEKDCNNRKPLRVILVIGLLVASYMAYCLVFYNVRASISCYHIQYDVYYPIQLKFSGIFYFIPTVIPPIISSIKRLRLLGVIILLSYIFTDIFYENYLVSVWCYFAAIISMVALSVIIQLNEIARPSIDTPKI